MGGKMKVKDTLLESVDTPKAEEGEHMMTPDDGGNALNKCWWSSTSSIDFNFMILCETQTQFWFSYTSDLTHFDFQSIYNETHRSAK